MDWFDQVKTMRLEILAARLGLAMRDRHVVACLACGARTRGPAVAEWHLATPALEYWESEAEALVAALETGGGAA